jgi:hypothetical protein
MFTITKQSSLQNSEIHSIMYIRAYGSFTLVKFVSEIVSDSDMKQYLPWPPWVTRQEIETILSVSHHPRWPMQVNSDCCCQQHYRITFANVSTALKPYLH